MLSFRHYIECAQYNGGEIGIRTLDTLLTYAGFQDRCIQPLCHLSALCDVFSESSAQAYNGTGLDKTSSGFVLWRFWR